MRLLIADWLRSNNRWNSCDVNQNFITCWQARKCGRLVGDWFEKEKIFGDDLRGNRTKTGYSK